MARKTSLSIVFGLLVVTAASLFVLPAAIDELSAASGSASRAKATVAQRYQLRQRTNNFYNRSKISYTKRRA